MIFVCEQRSEFAVTMLLDFIRVLFRSVAPLSGRDALCATVSCLSVHDDFWLPSGDFWVDPASTGAFEATCDNDDLLDGGWTLVQRGVGGTVPLQTDLSLNELDFWDSGQTFKYSDSIINALVTDGYRFMGVGSVVGEDRKSVG